LGAAVCSLHSLQTTLLGELRQLGAAISQDIYQESPNVKWSDIKGLTEAKRWAQVSLPGA
jgi:katanin p60 ATPase-containing subunit A1